MNAETEYVRMHVINYEPTYLALNEAVALYVDGEPISVAREYLADAVFANREAMGLAPEHLTDEVEYTAMIEFEVNE